jgi:hypothetical protein
LPVDAANAFQMVVRSKSEFEIHVELGDNVDFDKFLRSFDHHVKDILKKKKMEKLVYKYTIVDKIEADPQTGKYKAIIT